MANLNYVELIEKKGCQLSLKDLEQIELAKDAITRHNDFCLTDDPHASGVDLFIDLAVVALANEECGMDRLVAKLEHILWTIDAFSSGARCGDHEVSRLAHLLSKFNSPDESK